MNIEDFRNYCLNKKGVTEGFLFDETTLVFKVGEKVFTITNIEMFESINVKCDPELAIELRERYTSVLPGYHMNKKHWNTIVVNSDMDDSEVKKWVDHSYQLVFDKLPKKIKDVLVD
ncbi:MmcQ/YjbR family DNA-binding protein [Flammeovirga agarivorans]|uniref:MmcQ/YjbR family DNA-binding protein n=1 Tax=Flammeovirga agarivorans TaxID=2726742 RepID=A0A7X8SPY9_9BACT|nr:MmcQ/YjbR family DNA-binding protein [Flammeovirga agarivorans]NLR94239.1 MmcQ/YjbR family DNA-binding protein [Flammeovirga agarivorans]